MGVLDSQLPHHRSSQDPEFAGDVFSPCFWRQIIEIENPLPGISAETPQERRTPPGGVFVARVRRRRVEEDHLASSLALSSKLPGHFISDVSSETVSAEQVGALTPERANLL